MQLSRVRPLLVGFLAIVLTVAAPLADGGANHRVSSDNYGVSGGNVNNASRVFCCSGTLGALVQDSANVLYILSNNHVLARSNTAVAGEDVSQPGLADTGCRPAEIVADLSAYPLLSSNVDAAIAQLRPGAMRTDGAIEDIGPISSTVAAPVVGGAVQKSGRTTGHTRAAISAINVSVTIQYQQGCGTGRRFRVTFTDQVVVEGAGFSAGGDSGSLIVTAADGAVPQPVALLFAGSSTVTIGNPAGEVLSKVGTALGSQVSFVGHATRSASETLSALTAEEIARGTRAKDAHAARLMEDPAIVAVGVGEDPDDPGQAAVVIYAERGLARAAIARQLDGVATRVVETDPIVAYGWNERLGGSCAVR